MSIRSMNTKIEVFVREPVFLLDLNLNMLKALH